MIDKATTVEASLVTAGEDGWASALVAADRHLALAIANADLPQLVAIRDQAAALAMYAQQHREYARWAKDVVAVRLRSERAAGELMASLERSKGGRPSEDETPDSVSGVSPYRRALIEARVDERTAQRWQAEAAISEATFIRYIEEDQEPTSAGLLKYKPFHSVSTSSASPEWYTPARIVRAVVQVLGTIDLDPCSNSRTTPNVPATTVYTAADDGLAQPWTGRVFLNPPYGTAIGKWVGRLVAEYAAGNVTEAIALVPAKPDTAWWDVLSWGRICFVRGRLTFVGHATEAPAPFPSALVYFGPHPDSFDTVFGEIGGIYERRVPLSVHGPHRDAGQLP